MKLVFKTGTLLLIVALVFTSVEANWANTGNFSTFKILAGKFNTGKQEYTKTIKKEFPISPDGTTSLKNKYGMVDVKTWEKNRVKIDVTIVVKANSESTAQEVFDRISIDFANDDNFVKAATNIESKKNNWWGWNDNKTEFNINYEVFMPKSGSIELTNKYGDAHVAAIDGKANVNVKYGNFRLEGVKNDCTIDLGYGAGTVVEARDINANASYCKLNFQDAQDINFTSQYSKITVDKATDVKTDSRYDTYTMGDIREFKCQGRYGEVEIASADNIVASSRYTDYYIERVDDRADLDLQFGGCTVEKVAKGFSEVKLIGKYTDYKIGVEPGAIYVLEANAEYAGINYPSGINVTYEKDKGVSHEVKAHTGSQNARSVIKASLNYGGLKVK